MSDDNTQAAQTESTQAPLEAVKSENMIPHSRFNQVIQERNDARAKIVAIETAQSESEAAKMLEQKRFEELYNTAQAKVESLTQAQAQADLYKAGLVATNQARIERIAEDKRSLVPDYDDPIKMGAWLDANLSLFTEQAKPKAPSLDGGAGIQTSVSSSNIVKLTPLEMQMADSAGMSYEDYAIGKSNRNKPINVNIANKE